MQDAVVIGHTGQEAVAARAPVQRTGIVIGLSHNDGPVRRVAPVARAPRPRSVHTLCLDNIYVVLYRTEAAPARRNTIVIGSTRRYQHFLQHTKVRFFVCNFVKLHQH